MIYFGIDPGQKGAIACLSEEGKVILLEDLTAEEADYFKLFKIVQAALVAHETCACYLENVWALPQQSTTSGFKFGKNVGKAEMLAYSILPTYSKVVPSKWKKHFGLTALKREGVLLAREKWPGQANLFLLSKDGRAEACLIAEYGRQIEQQRRKDNE